MKHLRTAKFFILFVLIALVIGMFASCTTGKKKGKIGTPSGRIDNQQDLKAKGNISSLDAWEDLKKAVRSTSEGNKRYINIDTELSLDFKSQINNPSRGQQTYSKLPPLKMRLAANIDTNEIDAASKLALDVYNQETNTKIMGFYYDGAVDVGGVKKSMFFMDLSGLKKSNHIEGDKIHQVVDSNGNTRYGVYAVNTEDINPSVIFRLIQQVQEKDPGVLRAIAQNIFGLNLGNFLKTPQGKPLVSVTIERLFKEFLLGHNRVSTKTASLNAGDYTLDIPLNMGLVTAMIPLALKLLPGDIFELANRELGINLETLTALASLEVNIKADIVGGKIKSLGTKFSGIIDSDMNKKLVNKYGAFHREFLFNLEKTNNITSGFAPAADINFFDENNRFALRDVDGQMIDLNKMATYNPLQFDVDAKLKFNMEDRKFTVENAVGMFGDLLKNILNEKLDINSQLYQTLIETHAGSVDLDIRVAGKYSNINFGKTEFYLEVKRNGEILATVAYIGSEDKAYADLSKVTGSQTKLKTSNLELEKFLINSAMDVYANIKSKLNSLATSTSAEERNVYKEYNKEIKNTVAMYTTAGETPNPTIDLIYSILKAIKIDQNQNIANIKELGLNLTKEVLNKIFSQFVFKDKTPSPIEKIDISWNNSGFGLDKTFKFDAKIEGQNNDILNNFGGSFGIEANMVFGKYKEGISGKISDIKADPGYIEATKSSLKDGLKNLGLNLENVNVKATVPMKLETNFIQGQLLKMHYQNEFPTDGNDKKEIFGKTLRKLIFDFLVSFKENMDPNVEIDLNAALNLKSGFNLEMIFNSEIELTVKGRAKSENEIKEIFKLNISKGEIFIKSNLLGIEKAKLKVSEILPQLESLLKNLNKKPNKPVEENNKPVAENEMQMYSFVENAKGKYAKEVTASGDEYYLPTAARPAVNAVRYLLNVDASGDFVKVTKDKDTYFKRKGELRDDEKPYVTKKNPLIPILTSLISGIDLSNKKAEAYLASGIIAKLASVLKILDKVSVDFEDVHSGKVYLKYNGLKLGETELGAQGLIGANKVEFKLSGMKFGASGDPLISGRDKQFADTTEAESYVDVFEKTQYYAQARTRFNFDLVKAPANIMNLHNDVKMDYTFDMKGSLDFAPLLQYLQGKDITTTTNRTEFLMELRGANFKDNVSDDDRELYMGAYYSNGYLHLDMSKLGIEKTKVKFDINEFLLSMLLKDAKTKINGASTTSALTCEETKTPSEEDMLDLALGIGLTLSSKKLQLKMLGALAEAIKKLFKIDSGKIDAVLNVYLEQIFKTNKIGEDFQTISPDLDMQLSTLDAGGNETAKLKITMLGLAAKLGNTKVMVKDKDLATFLSDDSYVDVQVFDKYGDISLKQAYAEFKGNFEFNAASGSQQWTVGEWIKQLWEKIDPDKKLENLKSIIGELAFKYNIPLDVAKGIGYRIAANLRLGDGKETFNLRDNAKFVKMPKKITDPDWEPVNYQLYKYNESLSKFIPLVGDEIVPGTGYSNDVFRKVYLNEKGNYFEEVSNEERKEIKKYDATKKEDKKKLEALDMYLKDGEEYLKITADAIQGIDESTRIYKRKSPFDLKNILSNSDISMEFYNGNINDYKFDEKDVDDPKYFGKVNKFAVRILSQGEKNAKGQSLSTVYLEYKDFRFKVEDIAFESLFKKNGSTGENGGGGNSGDNNTKPSFTEILKSALSGIDVDSDKITAKIAPTFVASLVKTLFNIDVDKDNFVSLNEYSQLSLRWADLGFKFGIGVDPFTMNISVEKWKISLSDKNTVLPSGFDSSIYTSPKSKGKFSSTVDAELELKLTDDHQVSIKLRDYLAAFNADLLTNLGIDIEKNVTYKFSASLGYNLDLKDPSKTEIYCEIYDKNTKEFIARAYLKGNKLMVDKGIFGKKAEKPNRQRYVIENTKFSTLLINEINNLFDKVKNKLAQTTGSDITVSMDVFKNAIGISVTQKVVLALIGFITKQANIKDILDKMPDQDFKLFADANFETWTVNAGFTSKIGSMVFTIKNPTISTDKNTKVSNIVSEAERYVSISKEGYDKLPDTAVSGELDKEDFESIDIHIHWMKVIQDIRQIRMGNS